MFERTRRWRVLRGLLPRWYAERYGADLLDAHVALAGGRAGSLRFWFRLTTDVVLTTLQLCIDARRAPRPRPAPNRMDIMVSAMRDLLRAPGFALAVVLTLGLGIGATVTLFTVLDRLLLSPPQHVRDAAQVRRVYVHGQSVFTGNVEYSAALSYPDYRQLRSVAAFAAVAAYDVAELTYDASGGTRRIRAELASASYFPLLGVQPQLGRFYTEAEDVIAHPAPVVVLSHGFWQREYGGARDVVGRSIRLGKADYTVIGVAPRGFTGIDLAPVDVWVPLHVTNAIASGTGWENAHNWYWFGGIVRLAADASAAEQESTAKYRVGRESAPGRQDPDARVVLAPVLAAHGPRASEEAQVARALGALAVLVLLIACANVVNLLLARGIQRRRVLAIQTALGVSRSRLVQHLVLESLLLAVAAGVVALVFTQLLAPILFRTLLPDAALATDQVPRQLLFTLGVALLVSLLVGVLPALRSTRFDVLEALRTTRATRRGSSLRRGLLFAQAALSTVLIVGAGMFLSSLRRAQQRDLGVDTSTLAVQFELQDGTRFGEGVMSVSYDALARIRALPFVRHAAVTQLPQFWGNYGITVLAGTDTIHAAGRGPFFYTGTGDYFAAVGLRILRGRALTDDDDRPGAAPVAVLSESMARAAFGDRAALGQCLFLEPGDDGARPPCTQVVGVVENMMPSIRAKQPNLNVYIPPHHPAPDFGYPAAGVVMVAVAGDPAARAAVIRDVARGASPDIRLVEVNQLRTFLDGQLRPWRLGAVLLTAFGLLALIVSAAGLYSVLAFDVAQRRYELGVRAALGASARGLVTATTARALVVCSAGIVTGFVAAVWLANLASSLLFQVRAFEPRIYAFALLTLLPVVLFAAVVPAWRAARTDPRTALFTE